MKRFNRLFFIVAILPCVLDAGTFSDNQLGYSVTLPVNWVQDLISDRFHSFYDSTGRYQALIGIYLTDFSQDTLYPAPEEWSRAQFISNELLYRSDPYTAIILFDSISIRQNGIYWAPEIYAYHYEVDTSSFFDYADYIRYTAVGKTGYELYVVSTITDLDSNIAFYSSLLDAFQIRGMNASIARPSAQRGAARLLPRDFRNSRYDLLGRQLNGQAGMSTASQLLIRRCAKSCILR